MYDLAFDSDYAYACLFGYGQVASKQQGGTEVPKEVGDDDVPPLVPDLFNDEDDSNDEMDDATYAQFKAAAMVELKRFRTSAPDFNKMAYANVLKWWRANAHTYPILAEIARIVFAVPGSHIECEFVFSMTGSLSRHLRNRMSVQSMEALVFLRKNMDPIAEMMALMSKAHGETAFSKAKADLNIEDSDFAELNQVQKEMDLA